jgi:hypothetical protein
VKKLAKNLTVGDVIVYSSSQLPTEQPRPRNGLQSSILELDSVELYVRVRVLDGWLNPFSCNQYVEIQNHNPFDRHTLQSRSGKPDTVWVGNKKISIG